MRLRDYLRWSLVLGALGFVALDAQTAPLPKLEVLATHFNLVTAPGSNSRWLETDVEVNTRVIGGRSLFLDHVRVTLSLGTRTLGGGYRYYRADLEAATLENGPAHFRFYLPAEVVKRDGLTGEAEFWSIKITANGDPVPATPRNTSVTLRGADPLRAFETKLATGAPANDGILVPQHLSPFSDQYPTATPAPVRRP